ncbi:hypothetical protein L486_01621 [Kwoniella mangroviensis CBS 10435]|uniref:Uncharacterized protein n=1 Tax=Kwoniella mangroviensis CBS 10435 TaxID=1331196 RepID=A0A1B9J2D4_9TREE|nr:hypothetical protein L486_01621 [Kwoniella mangroviensis CBS 10435]
MFAQFESEPKPRRCPFSTEIFENFISFVNDQQTLHSLTLTSRLCNQIASPLLYKSITLTSRHQMAKFQAGAPSWAFNAVHHIEMAHTYTDDIDKEKTESLEIANILISSRRKKILKYPNLLSFHLTYQERPFNTMWCTAPRSVLCTLKSLILSQIDPGDTKEGKMKFLKVNYIKNSTHNHHLGSPGKDDELLYLYDLLLELRWKYKSIISVEASFHELANWNMGLVESAEQWRERIMNV